jgi:hypothetical protein
MKRKLTAFAVVIGVFMLFVASCQNESEENRAVVIVSSINDNGPFFSDVLEQGDTVYVAGIPYTVDDFISEDNVPVTFYNRPYNDLTTTGPGQPLSDFLVTRYRVEWRRSDGGPASELPPVYDGATSVQVPTNTFVSGSVLLVPFAVKNSPTYAALAYSPNEIMTIAHITFWGHEVGTNREWSFSADLSVNFGDWIIETKQKKQQQQ